MAYKLKHLTLRASRVRENYRNTIPEVCLERYKLVTDFYKDHPELTGITRRAKCLKHICENIPIRILDDEVIVGSQGLPYRACAVYPEYVVSWLKDELQTGVLKTRKIDPYNISDDDSDYLLSTIDYWMTECMSAKMDAHMIDEAMPVLGNGVTMFSKFGGNSPHPVGHFVVNYDKAINVGFAAIKAEADEKKAALFEQGMQGDTIDQYFFYRAISLVCEGAITLTKRYAALAAEMAEAETNENRKAELEMMAEGLSWTLEKPARTYYEALQCVYMYTTILCLDANMHGLSLGRFDQYIGPFYEKDLAEGRITEEYGQELMDLFYIKVAELNKMWSEIATQANPGYTIGMLMTLGGVKKDGTDATNPVTYMMLQASARLKLHSPPQAMRVHKGTPMELWEAGIETTKINGGVPTFENDDVIIPSLKMRGFSDEDANDYSIIGCVEPGGNGTEWTACGGTGCETFLNLANAIILAINDGYQFEPMYGGFSPAPEGTPNTRVGAPTGYLYEMTDIEQVKAAVKKQIEQTISYHVAITHSHDYLARELLPLPIVSTTIDGCMEKGKDVMHGGAKYNSTGSSGVGIGNVAESLNIINHCIFEKKVCTGRELYDALKANWEGYEDLHNYIINEAPHYGNGIPECDEFAGWVGKVFSDALKKNVGPRGCWSPGLYPVTTNVVFGYVTKATPDGRYAGMPLADGIAPVQAYDKNGPTAVLLSVAAIDQTPYSNGTLMNLKFHPTALRGEDGIEKMVKLMRTYFDMGGMELQLNVVSAETLREAQKNPEEYRDLVVRVAGFSAYFVELHIDGQEDLIRRTELAM